MSTQPSDSWPQHEDGAVMHTTEIVETKELNDEEVSYRVRCCGDPKTDSWHTASVMFDHSESLSNHHQQVRNRHERMQAWRNSQKAPQ